MLRRQVSSASYKLLVLDVAVRHDEERSYYLSAKRFLS